MSVVGDFRISTEAFALDHALSAVPETTVEADRLASHSPREVFPFLWATDADVETFTRGLEDDPSVESVDLTDELDGEALYRVTWHDEFMDLIHQMVDHHAAIMEARAHAERWRLRIRFADQSMVSSFQTHFRDVGHDFEVVALRNLEWPRQQEYDLTSEQYDALLAAVRGGYFSIPRRSSVKDVGGTLGISANAASQRIRRGCENLVRSSLLVDPEETD